MTWLASALGPSPEIQAGQHASTEDKVRSAVRRLHDGWWEYRYYYSALVELLGRGRPGGAPHDSYGLEEEAELEVALSMAALTLDAQAAGAAGSDGEVETGDIELAEFDIPE